MRFVDRSDLRLNKQRVGGPNKNLALLTEKKSGQQYVAKTWEGVERHYYRQHLCSLAHPNILCPRALTFLDGTPHILSEYHPPKPEAQCSTHSEDELIHFLAQALRGLSHIHQQGLIHGDIKPQNLFIDRFNNLRIGDLDWLRPAGSPELGGTPAFMSPERQQTQVTHWSEDLYALGLSFMKMSQRSTLKAKSISPQKRYPKLWPILIKLCATNTKDRYQSCSEGLEALSKQQAYATLFQDAALAAIHTLESPKWIGRNGILQQVQVAIQNGQIITVTAGAGVGGSRFLMELCARYGHRLYPSLKGPSQQESHGPLRRYLAMVAATGKTLLVDQTHPSELQILQQFTTSNSSAPLLLLVRPNSPAARWAIPLSEQHFELAPLSKDQGINFVLQNLSTIQNAKQLATQLVEDVGTSPKLLSQAMRRAAAENQLPIGPVHRPSQYVLPLQTPSKRTPSSFLHWPEHGPHRQLLARLAVSPWPLNKAQLCGEEELEARQKALSELCLRGMIIADDNLQLNGLQLCTSLGQSLSAPELEAAHRFLSHQYTKLDLNKRRYYYHHYHYDLKEDRGHLIQDCERLLEQGLYQEAERIMVPLLDPSPWTGKSSTSKGSVSLLSAKLSLQQGKYQAAMAGAQLALQQGKQDALAIIIQSHEKQGLYEQAIDLFNNAPLPWQQKGQNQLLLAHLQLRVDKAEEALHTLNRLDEARGPEFHNIAAQVHLRLENWPLAKEHAHSCLLLAEQQHRNDLIDLSHKYLSLLDEHFGNLKQAQHHLQKAIQHCLEGGNPIRAAARFSQLGHLHGSYKADIPKAINAHQQCLQIGVACGHLAMQVAGNANLARLYLHLGQLKRCEHYLHQAQCLFSNDLQQREILLTHSELLIHQGKPEAALSALSALEQSKLSLSMKYRSQLCRLRYQESFSSKEFQRAKALHLQCQADSFIFEATEFLLYLIENLWRQGREQEAIPFIYKSLQLQAQANLTQTTWKFHGYLALCLSEGPALIAAHKATALNLLSNLLRPLPPNWHAFYRGRQDRQSLLKALGELPEFIQAGPPSQVSQLLEINRKLNSSHDLKHLLTSIVDAAVELCHAERGYVLLVQPGLDVEVEICRNHNKQDVAEGEMRLSKSFAQSAMKQREGRLTLDALSDKTWGEQPSVLSHGLRSILCAPMMLQERVIGSLYLDHHLKEHAFNAEDLELITAFADQAALAIAQRQTLDAAIQSEAKALEAQAQIAELNKQLLETVDRQADALASANALNDQQKQALADKGAFGKMTIRSAAMQGLSNQLPRVAQSPLPLLITGESGTGKEVLARAIYNLSPRRGQAFISLNCGAISETLIESELFGHKKGAFTGAANHKPGLFQLAHQGILFLDEVGEMSPSMQVKILRAIQEGEIWPIGAEKASKIDVRIIAATHRNLQQAVVDGSFREDLFYRLRVISLRIPPLRERSEDLPLLCKEILEGAAPDGKRPPLSPAALKLLKAYPWPGNIRELQSVLCSASLFSVDGIIGPKDLKPLLQKPKNQTSHGVMTLAQIERDAIKNALTYHKGNKSAVARALGIGRKTLYEKIARHGL